VQYSTVVYSINKSINQSNLQENLQTTNSGAEIRRHSTKRKSHIMAATFFRCCCCPLQIWLPMVVILVLECADFQDAFVITAATNKLLLGGGLYHYYDAVATTTSSTMTMSTMMSTTTTTTTTTTSLFSSSSSSSSSSSRRRRSTMTIGTISNSDYDDNYSNTTRMPLPKVVSFLNSIKSNTNEDNSSNNNNNNNNNKNQLQSPQYFLEMLQRQNITRIATHGYITHRRSFGSSLAFIDLVAGGGDHHTSRIVVQSPLQALLKKQDYHHHRMKSSFASMLKSLYPGTRVYLEGVPCGTKNPGEVVLLVQYLRFEMCSRNPQHVKGLLMKLSQNLLQEDDHRHEDAKEEEEEEEKKKRDVVRQEKQHVGLCLEEVGNSLGPNINVSALKHMLTKGKGEHEVMGMEMDHHVEKSLLLLYNPSSQSNSVTKPYPINAGTRIKSQKNMVPMELSMARVIVKNLPQDLNYPFTLLMDQKGSNEVIYKTWLRIPDEVKEPPTDIKDSLQKRQENEIPREMSIRSLLDEVTKNKSYPNETRTMDLITIEGWVENRKRFQKSRNESVTILELVDEMEVTDGHDDMPDLLDSSRLKCVLHPECCLDSSVTHSGDVPPSHVYGHLLGKGSKVILQGYCCQANQRPIFWVRTARLARCTWRPSNLKYVFDLIAGSNVTGTYSFEVEEIASALDIGYQKAESIMSQCRCSDATERQWLAAKFSRKLQNGSSRYGVLTDEMKRILDQYACLRHDYPLEKIERDDIISFRDNFDNIQMLRRTASLKRSSEGSRWSSRKRPQLEFMAQQVKDVVESHADFGSRPLNILDVGGGRGYLSNYLSLILGSDVAKVHVIDIDSRAVRNGIVDAKRKGIINVQYGIGDASSSLEVAKLVVDKIHPKYDIIVALHACGALSDVALGHAVSNAASFVITPCCFMSNPFLRVPLRSHRLEGGERINMRPCEWLGLEEKNMLALLKAAELQGDINVSGEAIHTLCSLRARAVKRYWSETNNEQLDIRIKTFPIEFSTRNYCIVGKIGPT
jgi:Ribosomal protein L11 methylase